MKSNGKLPKIIGVDFVNAKIWDEQALQYPDGNVPRKLIDKHQLGETPGFCPVTLNAGEKLLTDGLAHDRMRGC